MKCCGCNSPSRSSVIPSRCGFLDESRPKHALRLASGVRVSPGDLATAARIRARYPVRNERTGCPPYARREYEAVPLETIAGEEGDERKVRKEGSSLACANRGASFRAARCAPRLHLPEIHHLRVPPPPPPPPSPPPAPFTSTCLFAFASTFSLCYSALSPLTALNCRQRASPDRRLLKPLSRSGTPACAAARGD